MILLFVFAATSCFSQKSPFVWDYRTAKAHAKAQMDSTQWNMKMFQSEGAVDTTHSFPIQIGTFPVAYYKSPGNGSAPLEFIINGKKLSGQAVFVFKGEQNSSLFKSENRITEVPFIILTTHASDIGPSWVTSRNHPNYLAEGRIPIKSITIDWLSMQLADRTAYAIVNMRLFDLRFGRLVIVAPQPDNTLRFLQVETGDLLPEGKEMPPIVNNLNAHISNLLKKKKVLDFVNRFGQ